MHKQRLAVMIAAGVGVISTFLPWVTVSIFGFSTSVNGIGTWQGILVFLLCVGAGILSFMGEDRNRPIEANFVKFVAIAGGVSFLLMLLIVISGGGAGVGSLGMGAYLALIASLAVLAVPFVIKDSGAISIPSKDSIKDEFNEMKDN